MYASGVAHGARRGETNPAPSQHLDPVVAGDAQLTRWDIVVAVLVVAGAAWLRHRPLGPPSLWTDDAWPALVVKVPWTGIAKIGLTAPGFVAGLKVWLHFTGFSETKAQSMAFVFGIAAPALMWILCVTRRLGRPAALVATALLLTSPAHIVFSTRVKQYTLDSVMVIALLWLTWRGLERPDDTRRWVLLAVGAAVATATSSGVLPVIVGAFCAAMLAIRRVEKAVRRHALEAGAAYGVFAVAWWVIVLRPRLGSSLHDYWQPFYVSTSNAGGLVGGLRVTAVRLAQGFGDLPAWVTVVIVVASAVVVLRTRRELAVMLLVPLLVAFVLAIFQLAPLGSGRTDIYLYPTFALLVGVAVSEISFRRSYGTYIGIALVIASLCLARAPIAYPQEDMKRAVGYLAAEARPADTVMVYPGGRYAFALYAPAAWPVTVFATNIPTNGFEVRIHRPHLSILGSYDTVAGYRNAIPRTTPGAPRVWLIGSHGRLDVLKIERALYDLGYRAQSRRHDHQQWFLSLWVRTAA